MAYTLTWADVLVVAPELSTVSADAQTLYVDWATADVQAASWPNDATAKRAATLLAAHFGASHGANAESGLQSLSIGPISKTYAQSSGNAADFESTTYGAMYRQLRRRYRAGPVLI